MNSFYSKKDVSKFGIRGLNSEINSDIGFGTSQELLRPSLKFGSKINLISWKFGLFLKRRYAVCTALLKGETYTYFKKG